MPDETNGVINAVNFYKETVQLLISSLPVFDKMCGMAINFVYFHPGKALIRIANTPLDRSAASASVLSVIN